VDALLESLAAPPPMAGLAKGNDAVDHITLHALSREAEIRDLAQGRARVRLLWEACQVPDFRKIADDSHTRLCGKIFGHLAKEGRLPQEWVAGSIAGLDNTEGDLDTLMARLANIRVWSYVAARADWLEDAAAHQNEARKAEDNVSDALHERLLARFVDRRAAHLIRSLDDSEKELLSAVTRQGEVMVEGHTVGRVKGFHFEPDPAATEAEEKRLVLRAARRALREEMPRRLAALETAKDEAFSLTPQHRVMWDGAEVARLRPGPEPLKPHIDPVATEFLDNAQRERVRARLAAWLEALVKRELGTLHAVEAKAAEDNTLRGPAFRLREGMGLVPGATERDIPADLRARLKAIGIRAGRYALYIPEVTKPRAMALRAQLWALRHHLPTPALPNAGLVSVTLPEVPQPPPADPQAPRPPESWPPGFAQFIGWLQAGHVLLRLDVVERVAGELGYLTRRAPAPLPDGLASRLGLKGDTLGMVLEAMGFRLIPAAPLEEGQFGPPLPARIGTPRAERPPRRPPQPDRPPQPPRQDAPRWDPAVMFGPPIPRELRGPRPDRGPRRDPRREGPRPDRPRQDAPRPEGAPQEAAPPRREARPDGPRPDRPRPDGPRPEGPPREGRREDRGPRPDRPRFDGPRRDRDRDGDRAPREYQSGPKVDSPFAVLAQLKLKKD
jgi:ATP-dependent RNA helicase SUPV3L1/SUV3